MEKNFDLLRPFDLEAAKRGEAICFDDGEAPKAWFVRDEMLYAEWADEPERFCQFYNRDFKNWRMAPLAWVEGKPVYKGGVLYLNWSKGPSKVEIVGPVSIIGESIGVKHLERKSHIGVGEYACDLISALTWQPPKVKREGWVNVYLAGDLPVCAVNIYRTKEEADALQGPGRIACVRIEWEE